MTAYRCKKCGKIEYLPSTRRGWHWKMGGEKCDGEWEEGEMVFIPKKVKGE